jgi:predicted transposase/invertase (TIGR01784 family)
MADYLKKQGSEVENMLMTEFNIDVAREVWTEEAREDGKAEGIAEGEARKALEMALEMIKDGFPIETASKYAGLPVDELCRCTKPSGSLQSPPQ